MPPPGNRHQHVAQQKDSTPFCNLGSKDNEAIAQAEDPEEVCMVLLSTAPTFDTFSVQSDDALLDQHERFPFLKYVCIRSSWFCRESRGRGRGDKKKKNRGEEEIDRERRDRERVKPSYLN